MTSTRERTFALCATCNLAIQSYETPSMLPGMTPDVEWVHVLRSRDGECGDHFAVPCRSIRDRVLMCADCRRPQTWQGPYWGWFCTNPYCPGVDKD